MTEALLTDIQSLLSQRTTYAGQVLYSKCLTTLYEHLLDQENFGSTSV